MRHIISNLWLVSQNEMLRIERLKLEHEIKNFGRALSVSTGESESYWEKTYWEENEDR